MDTLTKSNLPERNPETYAQHKKEVFWQIMFPMLIGIIILFAMLAFIFISVRGGASDLSRYADVSLIWLIIPSLIIALIFLIFLAAIIYLLTVLLQITPRYSHLILLYFEMGKYKLIHLSSQITEPIVKSKSIWAVVRHPGKFVNRQQDNHQ
jgi:amino acid transporter